MVREFTEFGQLLSGHRGKREIWPVYVAGMLLVAVGILVHRLEAAGMFASVNSWQRGLEVAQEAVELQVAVGLGVVALLLLLLLAVRGRQSIVCYQHGITWERLFRTQKNIWRDQVQNVQLIQYDNGENYAVVVTLDREVVVLKHLDESDRIAAHILTWTNSNRLRAYANQVLHTRPRQHDMGNTFAMR